MSLASCDSLWQSEKLPLDVLALVYRHLFDKRCVCGKFFAYEVRNKHLVSAMKTCRKWRQAWKRLIIACVRDENEFPLCVRPFACLAAYKNTHPPHPFFHLQRRDRCTCGKRMDEPERCEACGGSIPSARVLEDAGVH